MKSKCHPQMEGIMEKKQFQEEFDEARIYYDSLLDRDLFSLFKKSELTLSIAEGYTGGLISQRINKFHGSNTFFKAGLISNDIKTQINSIIKNSSMYMFLRYTSTIIINI